MKTFIRTRITREPILQIKLCDYSDSPRSWSNIGYFITSDSRCESPDKNAELEYIIKDTGDIATNQKEHMEMIKKEFKKGFIKKPEKVIAIYPIVKYEHSGIVYSLGERHGFDYSNNGFYIITDKTKREYGSLTKDYTKIIEKELDNYNKWLNGEVYEFVLYKKNGEIADSCAGLYSIEEIKEYLPKSWKNIDLSEYFINN